MIKKIFEKIIVLNLKGLQILFRYVTLCFLLYEMKQRNIPNRHREGLVLPSPAPYLTPPSPTRVLPSIYLTWNLTLPQCQNIGQTKYASSLLLLLLLGPTSSA